MSVNSDLTNDMKKFNIKAFNVETRTGGCADLMTWDEACQFAKKESIDHSVVCWVRREHEYTPEVIYFYGRQYEPVKDETE